MHLFFHRVTWPWRRTLTNGSDVKYALLRCRAYRGPAGTAMFKDCANSSREQRDNVPIRARVNTLTCCIRVSCSTGGIFARFAQAVVSSISGTWLKQGSRKRFTKSNNKQTHTPTYPHQLRQQKTRQLKQGLYNNQWPYVSSTAADQLRIKVDGVRSKQAVLRVITNESAGWASYTIRVANEPQRTSRDFHRYAAKGLITRIVLLDLQPDTWYRVDVLARKTSDRAEKWTQPVRFKTHGSKSKLTQE